jgi:GNAT superfamily N-acetyltransferase
VNAGSDPGTTIRRIGPQEGPLLRELRLRSLADAPEAFGQQLGEVEAQPLAEWQEAARSASEGEARAWFVATCDGQDAGLVLGRRRRPTTLLVFSMWVARPWRRLGVGRRLIGAAESWAGGWGATETILWVLRANVTGVGFYRRLGFEVVHEGSDAESGARYDAIAMRRPIAPPHRGPRARD